MLVKGSTIQQLELDKPKSRCRKWRLWATTDQGRKSRRFGGTYTQAQEALKSFVAELECQVSNPDSFASYAESWRLWRVSIGGLSDGTYERDRRDIEALKRTPLADMRMDAIRPEDCRIALMWLKDNPVRETETGRLSNTSVNKIGQTLKMVFAQAYDDGKIASNPMAKVKLPRPDTKEREALSPDEIGLFLNRLDELDLDGRVMALYFMACLGLRRGEAVALLCSDVSGGFCNVHQALKERTNRVEEPKTPAGVRKLPMPERLQAKVAEWMSLRSDMGISCEYLCCNTHGNQMTMQPFQKWWAKTRARIGCEGMVMHQLRHSNLSMMARHMSTFDLMAYAGWASIEPAKVYVHRDMDTVTRAVTAAWA